MRTSTATAFLITPLNHYPPTYTMSRHVGRPVMESAPVAHPVRGEGVVPVNATLVDHLKQTVSINADDLFRIAWRPLTGFLYAIKQIRMVIRLKSEPRTPGCQDFNRR
jgi:hypothetical protein